MASVTTEDVLLIIACCHPPSASSSDLDEAAAGGYPHKHHPDALLLDWRSNSCVVFDIPKTKVVVAMVPFELLYRFTAADSGQAEILTCYVVIRSNELIFPSMSRRQENVEFTVPDGT
ncbi:hypothetical protein ARMGADRAFT_1080525 [Armillaria gallica]|uniref:Uncharacterized protein n=1 Tax=Armillaria gallica TaxID=47427 RepID=A0A2H3DNL5_ARMGA|nr:hypothetical protein ARMGADRAFT_1080525 [Armillaria gallica]